MNEKKIAPASRVATVKEYYLQRKMQEVAALNADGHDIVSLGIGGPDRPAPDSAVERLKLSVSNPANHSYQVSKGIPALREAYAKWYKEKYGVILDPATEILPLIGSKEGILHISMTFLNPADKIGHRRVGRVTGVGDENTVAGVEEGHRDVENAFF